MKILNLNHDYVSSVVIFISFFSVLNCIINIRHLHTLEELLWLSG